MSLRIWRLLVAVLWVAVLGSSLAVVYGKHQARTRFIELQRLTAALLADAGTPWVDAGVAESPEGKADILEAKEETGRTLRLFIDQNSHLPLMVQYQDPKPMVMIAGGPGGPGGPGGAPRGPGGAGPGALLSAT